MRHARCSIIAAFALTAGCAHVEYQGQPAVAKPGPAPIVSAAPSRPHRAIGRIAVEKIMGEDLEMMLARLGQEGGKRGCDVVVCNVNNAIVDGVQSSDPTGVRYFSTGSGGRVPDGVYGECETFQ